MHCLQVAVGTFRSTETFEKLAFEYRGFSLRLAERFLAARSKEKRLYSQAIWKIGNSGKWYRNFPEKFPDILETVEFPKREPFNRRF